VGSRALGQLGWSAAHPVSMRLFQGQPRGSRRRRRRPLRMMRPATLRSRKAFGFPAAGGLVVPGQRLGPGQKVGGESDDLQPDLVLSEPVEGYLESDGGRPSCA
jgi:hypothetical protein